jgi:hypothetical protein
MTSRASNVDLAAWWWEWSRRHGVHEVEDAHPEAQEEYHRRAYEILGLDPDTGMRPGIAGRRRRHRT